MSEVHIISLIKFGSEHDILDLYDNGTIYCNTIEYFRKREDNEGRGDAYEGSTMIKNYPKDAEVSLEIAGQTFRLNNPNLHVRSHYEDILGNMYCLWSLTVEDLIDYDKFKIDLQNKKFGTHFMIIHNCEEFYKRLINGFKVNKLRIETGFVKYYDKENYSGKLDLFHKTKEFAYQREFRILISNNKNEVMKFSIGSLHDLAEVHSSSVLEGIEYNAPEPIE